MTDRAGFKSLRARATTSCEVSRGFVNDKNGHHLSYHVVLIVVIPKVLRFNR